MNSVTFCEETGDWCAHSDLTGLDYWGSNLQLAKGRRWDAEQVYYQHHRKNPGEAPTAPSTAPRSTTTTTARGGWVKVAGARSVRRLAV